MNKTILVALCAIPASAGVVATLSNTSDTPLAPHAVVLESVQAARDNDVSHLMELVAPAGELARLEAEWDAKRSIEIEPTDALGFQFAMGMLTAEGAEAALMAQLEPKLAELRGQQEFFAQMATGIAQAQVAEREGLTDDQRAESAAVLAALQELLVSQDFADPARAQQAINIVCRTARSLEVDSLETLNALEFDQLLDRGDMVVAGVKEVLVLYGVDIDDWLESVHAETVSEQDGKALVRVSYEFVGLKRDTELELVLEDGRWRSSQTGGTTPVR